MKENSYLLLYCLALLVCIYTISYSPLLEEFKTQYFIEENKNLEKFNAFDAQLEIVNPQKEWYWIRLY
jgi:hypothetical protein